MTQGRRELGGFREQLGKQNLLHEELMEVEVWIRQTMGKGRIQCDPSHKFPFSKLHQAFTVL